MFYFFVGQLLKEVDEITRQNTSVDLLFSEVFRSVQILQYGYEGQYVNVFLASWEGSSRLSCRWVIDLYLSATAIIS